MQNKVYFKALGLSYIEPVNLMINTKLYPQRAIGKG